VITFLALSIVSLVLAPFLIGAAEPLSDVVLNCFTLAFGFAVLEKSWRYAPKKKRIEPIREVHQKA
jgi:hypothetical protein